jgi:hypothetical protein
MNQEAQDLKGGYGNAKEGIQRQLKWGARNVM